MHRLKLHCRWFYVRILHISPIEYGDTVHAKKPCIYHPLNLGLGCLYRRACPPLWRWDCVSRPRGASVQLSPHQSDKTLASKATHTARYVMGLAMVLLTVNHVYCDCVQWQIVRINQPGRFYSFGWSDVVTHAQTCGNATQFTAAGKIRYKPLLPSPEPPIMSLSALFSPLHRRREHGAVCRLCVNVCSILEGAFPTLLPNRNTQW